MSQQKFNTQDDIVPIVLFFQRQGLQFEIPKLPDQINLPYPPSTQEKQCEDLFEQARTDFTHDAEILQRLKELDKQSPALPSPKSPKP